MLQGTSGGGKSFIVNDLRDNFTSVQFSADKTFVFKSTKDLIHNLVYLYIDEMAKTNLQSIELKKLLEAP